MLATIGFSVTSILFLIFALKIQLLADRPSQHIFKRYANAYLLLALAFAGWGVASAIGTFSVLAFSVVIGDILMLVATLLILSILLERNTHKQQWLYCAGIVGAILLTVRTIFFYPEPYMIDQVLFFNSQRLVSFTIAAAFLLIWLPVNLQIARLVTRKVPSLTSLYSLLYATASLSAVIFLLAKAPLTLVLSFTAISAAFMGLVISNKYIKALQAVHHGK